MMTDSLHQAGKLLVFIGASMIMLGVILMTAHRIPWLGRLPGDILIERKNFVFYAPLATSILISIVLTILFWFFGRR